MISSKTTQHWLSHCFSAVDSSGVQLGRGTVPASFKVTLRPEAQSTATLTMYATYLSKHRQ